MTPQLRRRLRLLQRGLEETRPLWPDLRQAFGWVHQMAHVLSNNANLPAEHVAQKVDALTQAMGRDRGQAGALAGAVDHFLKVTASSRPGLFQCDRVPGLPRTNNDLEHLFGSHRHHERRATGRKTASPSLGYISDLCRNLLSRIARHTDAVVRSSEDEPRSASAGVLHAMLTPWIEGLFVACNIGGDLETWRTFLPCTPY